ncbi:MAG TPA: hypothetical protein V6D12_13710 [Candidatus Obscuribacterales bacterium]
MKPRDVAPIVVRWSLAEIEEMIVILEAAKVASTPTDGDEDKQTTSSPSRKRKTRAGYFEQKMINGCGPYRYLRYYEKGRLKSVYVGKGDSE